MHLLCAAHERKSPAGLFTSTPGTTFTIILKKKAFVQFNTRDTYVHGYAQFGTLRACPQYIFFSLRDQRSNFMNNSISHNKNKFIKKSL